MKKVRKTINSEVAKCIKAIGEDLIKRADDISRDLDRVATISINSVIQGGEIINYEVNKNYNVEAYIDYQGIRKDGESNEQ